MNTSDPPPRDPTNQGESGRLPETTVYEVERGTPRHVVFLPAYLRCAYLTVGWLLVANGIALAAAADTWFYLVLNGAMLFALMPSLSATAAQSSERDA